MYDKMQIEKLRWWSELAYTIPRNSLPTKQLSITFVTMSLLPNLLAFPSIDDIMQNAFTTKEYFMKFFGQHSAEVFHETLPKLFIKKYEISRPLTQKFWKNFCLVAAEREA